MEAGFKEMINNENKSDWSHNISIGSAPNIDNPNNNLSDNG